MRYLLTLIIVVVGAVHMARAETLFLNPAGTETADVVTTAVSHPDPHPAGHELGHAHHAGCQTGHCQHGSLDQYPGGCCEDNGAGCAALWADYCRDKKSCWTPGSPRRHSTGCGIPLPSLHLPHFACFKKFGHTYAACDDGLNLSCDTTTEVATQDVVETPSITPYDQPAPPVNDIQDVDPAGDVPEAPAEIDSAASRRSALPFGWKLPTNSPFKKSPTARLQLPFSR